MQCIMGYMEKQNTFENNKLSRAGDMTKRADKMAASILFATVPFTLANKRWRYATALLSGREKKEWVRGGRDSEKRGGVTRRA